MRRKLQEQLDAETKKIQKLEAALKAVSYETLVQIKESIAKEAAQRENEQLQDQNGGSTVISGPESQTTNGSTEILSRISNTSAMSLLTNTSNTITATTTTYR